MGSWRGQPQANRQKRQCNRAYPLPPESATSAQTIFHSSAQCLWERRQGWRRPQPEFVTARPYVRCLRSAVCGLLAVKIDHRLLALAVARAAVGMHSAESRNALARAVHHPKPPVPLPGTIRLQQMAVVARIPALIALVWTGKCLAACRRKPVEQWRDWLSRQRQIE